MSRPTAQLHGLLGRPGVVLSFAAHDVFTARVMEQAGIELLFLGGFGAAASLLGLPDIGLLTMTEMSEAVRRMTAPLRIPLVADADTGHGDWRSVIRTVQEFENAGAAGMLLEDQVSPKRCGHFDGKRVIPADEMLVKLRAAIEARRDPKFVIMARTDARDVEGVAAAIDRANQYGEAGADVCFVESPGSREELEQVGRDVRSPLLANMLTGGRTPILSAEELGGLGYKIVVCPVESLLICGAAVRKLVEALRSTGRVDHLADEMLSFEEVKDLLGLGDIERLGQLSWD